MKWNLESCRIEALKYNTRKEFRDSNQGCYNAARKQGFLNEICINMKNGKLIWDKDKVIPKKSQDLGVNKSVRWLWSFYIKRQIYRS